MPDAVHLDFEEPESKRERRKREREEKGLPPKPQVPHARIPELPRLDVDMEQVQRRPDQRAVACVNMRLAGAPFHAIAKELGYASATSARSAYIAALAQTNPPEDWETLRRTEEMRAEQQLARSMAMANATYLIVTNEDGVEYKVPNLDRIRWHEQARHDLSLHATITGAKAPVRAEVSVSSAELNEIVDALLAQMGENGDVESNILELDELPAEVDEED